jgi:hypothetical protein
MDRLDLLQYLADAQDGIGKALRFLSKIPKAPEGGAPLIDDAWQSATRVQRYITDAQEDLRREDKKRAA